MRWNRNAKQVIQKKKKKGVSREGQLEPCVWGSAMQPWVPGRSDGREIVQACAWLCVSLRQRSDKELQLKEQRWMGEDGLASFGLGDVEINFYIPSCFIVPFTGEQVQSYLSLPLLLESHKSELHKQSV